MEFAGKGEPAVAAGSEPAHDDAEPLRRTTGAIHWRYTRAEIRADAVVHVLGLALVAVGASALLIVLRAASAPMAAAAVYLASLALCFGASAAYNLSPVSRRKWLLRRIDQSAIYLLIAGTYTPFLAAMGAWLELLGIWLVAGLGVGLRLWRPGGFDRLAIALYLALGWSGLLTFGEAMARLPAGAPALIAAGGVVYSLGVVFHVWRKLPFHNAIWHVFVLAAAAIHYLAVWKTVTALA